MDELIVATGFRPDLDFVRELRVQLDPAIECPVALAPLIDPNEHSCGTVRPHGARELAQPEPGFYFAGMKSYGRAPTFLMLTGYEQVRSIAADIAGDHQAAARVELVLPETGVCSRAAAPSASQCCGGPAPAKLLTPAASRMQMPNNKARADAAAASASAAAGDNAITLTGRSVIVAMCVGQLEGSPASSHVVVPSHSRRFLIPEWQLSGAQAGLLAGSGAAGYMLTVPVLATLTDRIDARKILIAGSAVSALGTLLFGLFATGLWSGALFNAIAGIGFAGAYMPGLKALTDRLAPGDSSRAITFYTSSFSFGVGLSFLVAQLVAESFGWRSAFYVTALGPLVMLGVCWLLRPVAPKPAQGRLLDFAPVIRNTNGDGIRARLRRALFRALWHPDLAGRVLDVRHHQTRTNLHPDACCRQRGVLAAGDARQHFRQ